MLALFTAIGLGADAGRFQTGAIVSRAGFPAVPAIAAAVLVSRGLAMPEARPRVRGAITVPPVPKLSLARS